MERLLGENGSCGPSFPAFDCNETSLREGGGCPYLGSQTDTLLRAHLLIVIAALGMLFNVVTVLVLFNVYFRKSDVDQQQQKSLWLLLTSLAISDTVELVIYMTTYSLIYLQPESYYITGFHIPNQNWIFMLTSATMTFNRWIVVLLSASRAYIIWRAKKGLKFDDSRSKLRKLCFIVVGILVASMIFNAFRLREYDVIPCRRYDPISSKSSKSYKLESSDQACESPFLWGYSTVFMVGINNITPFLFLIAANAYVVVKLIDKREEMAVDPTGNHAAARRKRNLNQMCVAVSIVYFFCQMPYIIQTVQKAYDRIGHCEKYTCLENMCSSEMQHCPFKAIWNISSSVQESDMIKASNDCIKQLETDPKCFCDKIFPQDRETSSEKLDFFKYLGMIINCSSNFFIYTIFSSSFRQVMIQFLRGIQRPIRGMLNRPVAHEEMEMEQKDKKNVVNAGLGATEISRDTSQGTTETKTELIPT